MCYRIRQALQHAGRVAGRRRGALLVSALAAVPMALVPGAVGAHDLWLERHAPGFTLQLGHRGGAAVPLDASRVRSIRCLASGRPPIELRPRASSTGQALTVPGSCEVASALLDGGFWCLTPDGERNLPKTRCPDAVQSWRSKQLAKWVDVSSSLAGQPIGDELEIVPVTGLARVKAGDKASFRVLLKGQPVAGAVVSVAHKALGETDSAGTVRVRIRAADIESISVSVRRPLSSPDADAEVLEASLTFEVGR